MTFIQAIGVGIGISVGASVMVVCFGQIRSLMMRRHG